MPNLTVLSPACFSELEDMLELSIEKFNSPVVIRYPRGTESEKAASYISRFDLREKKSAVLKEGKDISIFTDGIMCGEALEVAEKLSEKGIEAEVIYLRYLKPLDIDTIKKSAEKTKKCVVMENGGHYGGIHSVISSITGEKLTAVNTGDEFVCHGNVERLKKELGMDSETVYNRIIKEYF